MLQWFNGNIYNERNLLLLPIAFLILEIAFFLKKLLTMFAISKIAKSNIITLSNCLLLHNTVKQL